MSNDTRLTNEELEAITEIIAEKLIAKVEKRHRDFYIDPESHYQEHMAMRDVVAMVRSGQSIFWKAFVGMVVLGAITIAAYGMAKKLLIGE